MGRAVNTMNGAADFPFNDICVVIPTLNEITTLHEVITGVLRYSSQVLVVDGGSSDGTVECARSLGVQVIEIGHGKGLAIRHALDCVAAPVTVFIDADGSHDPKDIPQLALPVLRQEYDLVIGSRWTGGSDELHGDMNKWLRRSGSRFLTTLVNWRFGGNLSDIQNGFRALSTNIGREIGLACDDFTIEQEITMKFLAGGLRVTNVPTHEYSRRGGTAKLDLGDVWFNFGVVVLRHLFGISRPQIRR